MNTDAVRLDFRDGGSRARVLRDEAAMFCRCFKWETGLSPYQYMLRCRIERACALLAAKDEPPLQEIAFACGFGDPVQFSRQFKKATGMTPSACRAASRSWKMSG